MRRAASRLHATARCRPRRRCRRAPRRRRARRPAQPGSPARSPAPASPPALRWSAFPPSRSRASRLFFLGEAQILLGRRRRGLLPRQIVGAGLGLLRVDMLHALLKLLRRREGFLLRLGLHRHLDGGDLDQVDGTLLLRARGRQSGGERERRDEHRDACDQAPAGVRPGREARAPRRGGQKGFAFQLASHGVPPLEPRSSATSATLR